MMNDTSSEDPWASLAEELGVAEPVPERSAPKRGQTEHKHAHAPVREPKRAEVHSHVPEVPEAPDPLDGTEEAEGDDEASDSATGEGAEGGPEAGKKRRRRRRRGKKKPDEAGVPAAATEVVSPAADTVLDVEESAEEGEFEPEQAEAEESEPDHLAVALDEEMEADNSHENTVWKVTSWKELVAGLHRPER